MTKTNELATKTEQVSLMTPQGAMQFATSLKELIVQNRLFSNIKGKNYVNVEGWQIAGAFTGTFPVVEKVEELPAKPGEVKYRAEVSLRDAEGKLVGYGVAICSNREPGKKSFDEYAVASMAQTRAVGKAYRLKIGWLLKVAGYETTPAEEMDAVEAEVVQQQPQPEAPAGPSMRDVSYAKSAMEQAKCLDDLKTLWATMPAALQSHPEIIACKDALKAKLVGEEKEKQDASTESA